MFISEPVDIASSPCVVRVGPEAVDSHHIHKRSGMTALTWRTIQKLESKSDGWFRRHAHFIPWDSFKSIFTARDEC